MPTWFGVAGAMTLFSIIDFPTIPINFQALRARLYVVFCNKANLILLRRMARGDCTISGIQSADTWKGIAPTAWPLDAQNNSTNGARLFRTSPKTGTPKFSNVYKKPNDRDATLLDVLIGVRLNGSTGLKNDAPNPTLGKEAVAALLNSLKLGAPAAFPIPATEVTRLFNGVINGGTVEATAIFPGKMWDADKVLAYFQCINGTGTCPVSIPAL